MRRTNGGSRYSVPLRVIPERGKVRENLGESSSAKSPDVLHKREAWSKLANQAGELSPKAASLSVKTCTAAGQRDVLAREAPADGVDGPDPVGSKPGSVKVSHVFIDGHAWPVLGQHLAAKRIDLAQRDGAKARPLQAQRKPADA
jgi:hypothetical protein